MSRVDVTNVFFIFKIELVTLQRQHERLTTIFGETCQPETLTECSEFLRRFLHTLRKESETRLVAATPRGADEILVRQVLSALDVSVERANSTNLFRCHSNDLLSESDIRVDMIRSEVFGNAIMKVTRDACQSRKGLSKERLQKLKSLWGWVLSKMPCIERKLGMKIPEALRNEAASLPAALICGSWGCDIASEAFIDFSILWNWIRPYLLRSLNSPAQFGWLLDPESVMTPWRVKRWDLEAQDVFGHTFFHAAALVDRPEWSTRRGIQATTSRVCTKNGRTVLHYATAAGNEALCKSLCFRGVALVDKNGIFLYPPAPAVSARI